jgi:autotransporter-associated beta strand protein/probable HAF family extracellular repeat protein
MNLRKRRLIQSSGLLAGGLSLALPSAWGAIYSVTNIGGAVSNATGATISYGYALNDSGTVAGIESTNSYSSPFSVYTYSNGTVTAISSTANNFFSADNSVAINAGGSVAYTYTTTVYSEESAVYSPVTGQNTSVPDQGNGVTATGINSAGIVVGTLQVPYSSSYSTSQAYVLQNGVQTNVGAQFSGANASGTSYASAINDSGQIAGIGVVPGTNGIQEAYIATPNGSTGTYSFNNVGALVLAADSHRSTPNLIAINNAGWAVGTFNDYGGDIPGSQGTGPFAYYYNGSKVYYMFGLGGTSYLGVTPTAINNSDQIVGTSSLASSPYSTHAFLYQNGNTQDLNNLLDSSGAGWTLTNAQGINSSGQIVGYGTYNGNTSAFLLTPEAATLTWNNSLTIGGGDTNPTTNNDNDQQPTDGKTWDVNTTQNWNGGSTTVDTIFSNGDYVTFNDSNNGHYLVQIPTTVQPGSTTVNTAAAYNFTGNGGIGGTGGLVKLGTGSLSLSTSNTYTGGTNVSAGTLNLNSNGALPAGGALSIAGGAAVIVASHGTGSRFLLQPTTLSIAGSTDAWTGKLDLADNDLVVQSGNLASVTNQVKQGYASGNWNSASGITSSAAAANSSHLTALGVILNTINGTTPLYGSGDSLGLFDGTSPAATAVLVRYTYYGDTDLNGTVDGTDYSRIDNAYSADKTHPAEYTGWFNGDFNYDGVINGSDYTLIDNAFNFQGGTLPSSQVAGLATSTAQVFSGSGTAVPEPGSAALLGAVTASGLGRRRRLRST